MADQRDPDIASANGVPEGPQDLRAALSGLARIYVATWRNTAEWAVMTSLHAGSRLVRAAISGESASDLFEETRTEMREYAERILGIVDTEGRVRGAVSGLTNSGRSSAAGDDTTRLRQRGAELLRQSADVRYEESLHPAYDRILSDLAPDEARILRLLAKEGRQPAIDVRAGLPLVSGLVKAGLNMIGAQAGCRHLDRVHAYLSNLNRLGLIWFSREPLKDPERYQVLEAQPETLAALRKGGRTARTVRRSILLTPFGKDFCDVCLPLDTAEFEALTAEEEAKAPASA